MRNRMIFRLLTILVLPFLLFSFNERQKENDNRVQVIQVLYKLKEVNRSVLKVDDLEFELLFNSNSSIFRLVDKKVGNDKHYKIASIVHKGDMVFYANKTVQESIYNARYKNQIYNVKLDYGRFDWIITTETKIINGFKCYKATTTYEKIDRASNTVIKFMPEVWFTSEIPTSFGPKGLNGLPGLILEGTMNGKTYFYATNINRDNILKKVIERPKADTEISEKDYDDLKFEFYKND